MIRYPVICIFFLVFQTNAQTKWTSFGPSQDSTFLNRQSPGFETNALNVIESAPDGTLYRLYQKYCNANACNNPVTVLRLANNKWLPIGPAIFSNHVPAFKLDFAGIPYLVTSQNNGISCHKFENNAWQSAGSFSLNSAGNFNFKIKFDKTNTPYILYYSTADTNKLTLKKLSGNNWVSVGQEKFALTGNLQNPGYPQNSNNDYDFTLDANLNVYVGCAVKSATSSNVIFLSSMALAGS